jgi:hypothetical protein
MKKILMGSAVLTALSLSIIAFQVSCSKTANAQTGSVNTQQNKVLYTVTDSTYPYVGNGYTIWSANYDGTNAQKINVNLPAGILLGTDDYVEAYVRLSPDGKTMFFPAMEQVDGYGIQIEYSSSVDGTNAKQMKINNNAIVQFAY